VLEWSDFAGPISIIALDQISLRSNADQSTAVVAVERPWLFQERHQKKDGRGHRRLSGDF
jgi:hypothetical protein